MTNPTTNNATNRHYRPLPIDFLILEKLPPKGMIGGVYWRGRLAGDVVAEINEAIDEGPQVTSAYLQGRLRSMAKCEYVETFGGGPGGRLIWARTIEGERFLATKSEVLG